MSESTLTETTLLDAQHDMGVVTNEVIEEQDVAEEIVEAVPVSDLQAAMNKMPKLTACGFGLENNGTGLSPDEHQEAVRSGKQKMLNDTRVFDHVCTWLEKIEKSKSFNAKRTSFGLKTLIEKGDLSVSNGIFIAAAIHCGFKTKTRKGSLNVKFNMSEASLIAATGEGK